MPIPASGPLALTDIQTEFGGANPIGLNEYYAGGANVPAGTSGTYGAVPSSGQISIQNFYGTSKAVPGQQAYTTAGTYTFVVPTGITSISTVTVGPGSKTTDGGAGGGLSYVNNTSVTPGESLSVRVGSPGSSSYLKRSTTSLVEASAAGGSSGGSPVVGTGGTGGGGGSGAQLGGAGGAAGYSGTGGVGGSNGSKNGGAGAGGAGGGGAYGHEGIFTPQSKYYGGGGGGGVGLLGQGSSGAGGSWPGNSVNVGSPGGGGGSGGATGGTSSTQGTCCGYFCAVGGAGGAYGGGGGGGWYSGAQGTPADGAVRIIWPGSSRAFPSTCTGNL